MKKSSCMMAMAVFFVMVAGISVNSVYAVGCKDREVNCCLYADESQTVAKTKFTMCWSWGDHMCVPCHGGGKWSYMARWCNDNLEKCGHGKCWACFHNVFDPHCSVTNCWNQDGEESCYR